MIGIESRIPAVGPAAAVSSTTSQETPFIRAVTTAVSFNAAPLVKEMMVAVSGGGGEIQRNRACGFTTAAPAESRPYTANWVWQNVFGGSVGHTDVKVNVSGVTCMLGVDRSR